MRARTSSSAGFVLPELLVVMVVGLILLGGTLLTFERFVLNSDASDRRNDTAEVARSALDTEARQLRNLAKRVSSRPVINTIEPDDLVFQTSDPTRTWVRYCLDTGPGADKARVWEQTQPADAPGTDATCGPSAAGWAQSVVVSYAVVNRIDGRDEPLFRYRCAGGGTACTADPATWDQLVGIATTLFVDTTPRVAPEELKVSSSVYLRNQNQAPTPVIDWTTVASQPRTVQFNASGSDDFEGRTLQFYWFLGTMPPDSASVPIRCDDPTVTTSGSGRTLWGGRFLGSGMVLQYTWPGTTPSSGSAQTVGLVACDPGDRYGFARRTDLQIP